MKKTQLDLVIGCFGLAMLLLLDLGNISTKTGGVNIHSILWRPPLFWFVSCFGARSKSAPPASELK